MGPGDLKEILQHLPQIKDADVLVGLDSSDDAGVVLLNDEVAIVQTVDYITPICDDPYLYGQIAAANALSDIYAMGAKPFTALNLCNFPPKSISKETLAKILQGGLEKLNESGAKLIGGHTIKDEELKYGLAVTGLVNPQKIITNSGAKIGDKVILTKPLGTGMSVEAYKKNNITYEVFHNILSVMARLNKKASEIMLKYQVHACTDITGFALVGHSLNIAEKSKVTIQFEVSKLPIYPAALTEFKKGNKTGVSKAISNTYESKIHFSDNVPDYYKEVFFDPQTSGGLLICVDEKDSAKLLIELLANGITASVCGAILEKRDYPLIALMNC